MGSLTVQNLATSLLGFIFVGALLRLLPQTEYGIYSAVTLAAGIATSFAIFGLNTAATRYIAMLREKDENASWVAARSVLLLSLVFTVATAAVFLAISPFLSLYFTKSGSWTWIFLLGGAYLFLASTSAITQGIIQGLKRYGALAKIIAVSRIVMTVFAIAVLEFDRSVAFAMYAWLLYYTIILAWTLSLAFTKMVRASGASNYSEIMKYTFPLGVASLVAILSSSADQVVVGGYLTPSSLAVYNAAITISGVLGVVLVSPLTLALLPEASSSQAGSISTALRLALRIVTLSLLPAALLMTALAPQLLSLFTGGNGYLTGAGSMELITSFYFFGAVQLVALTLLQAMGKTTRVLVVGAISAAVDIAVAVSLVPTLGIFGAATSRVAVYLISSLLAMYMTKDYLKGLSLRFHLKGVLVAGLPAVLIFAMSQMISSRMVTLVPYTLLYGVLFLLGLKITRLLTDEDRTFIAHILPPSLHRFLKYI